MLYDPLSVKSFFDHYGTREWERLERTLQGRIRYAIHRHFLQLHGHAFGASKDPCHLLGPFTPAAVHFAEGQVGIGPHVANPAGSLDHGDQFA